MDIVPIEEFVRAGLLRSSVFDAKAQTLQTTYKCFFLKDSGREKERDPKWFRKPSNPPPSEEKRPVKFLPTTEEGLARKEFMPLMNKLSLKNKLAILEQIRKIFKPSCVQTYVDIIWSIALECPTYQALYIEALDVICICSGDPRRVREHVCEKLSLFIDSDGYMPPDAQDNEDYDEFCDYVKWKKKALATISLLMFLEKKGLVEGAKVLVCKLTQAANIVLEQGVYEKADTLMDMLLSIYSNNILQDEITAFAQAWLPRTQQMRPSTRFKFYTFSESMERNSKSINRWTSKTRLTQSLRS